MKLLSGHSHNIHEKILGKITRKKHLFLKTHNFIFIATTPPPFPWGYAAVLTEQRLFSTKRAAVTCVNGLSILHDGDVVLITPDGSIHVLYDSQSQYHALLVTERCNQNCVMCPQVCTQDNADKTELNLKLISLFDRKPGNIGLTGGEPTLIGQDLFTLIRALKRRIPEASISVLTNGVRFADFRYAQELAAVGHPDLQVEIPLYADTDTEHNRIVGAHTFYQTVQGLYNLARLRQCIGLRIVIHRQTYARLPQLAEFIYRNFPFVWHVMFMHMEPTGRAAQNIEDLWIDPFDCNSKLQEAVLGLYRRNMNVSIYNAPLCVLPKVLRPFARCSIADWKTMYLPICETCGRKKECAGFFSSAVKYHSRHITPF